MTLGINIGPRKRVSAGQVTEGIQAFQESDRSSIKSARRSCDSPQPRGVVRTLFRMAIRRPACVENTC